jgi:hypothetical protein
MKSIILSFVIILFTGIYMSAAPEFFQDTATNDDFSTDDVDIEGVENVIEKYNNETTTEAKFSGHWMGIELGLNMLVTSDFGYDYPDEYSYMDIRTGKSWNVNLNVFKYSFGLYEDRFGIVTGLGIEWNNYRFDGKNNIKPDTIGIVNELPLDTLDLNKSKLTSSYLVVPLLFEWQFAGANRGDRIHIAAGVLGGLKLGAHNKIVYLDDGDKQKDKDKGDFNLNPIRYGFTFRVGYKLAHFYANYYATPLFEKEGDPELYPFNVGLSFTF